MCACFCYWFGWVSLQNVLSSQQAKHPCHPVRNDKLSSEHGKRFPVLLGYWVLGSVWEELPEEGQSSFFWLNSMMKQNDESTCQGRGRRKSTGSGLSARGGWACQGKCPVMPGWIIPWGCVCGLILLPKPGLIHSEECKIARGRLCVKDHM